MTVVRERQEQAKQNVLKKVCCDFDVSQRKAPYNDTISFSKKETDLPLCFVIGEIGSTEENTA